MKIPAALESMVADLISDERQKREEVEAVLSKIHGLTAAYFEPEKEVSPFSSSLHEMEEDFEPAPRLSQAERIKNFTAFRERMGDPPARALEVAEEMSKEEPE